MAEESSKMKRARESSPESCSPAAKRIREDLLVDLLDDADSGPAVCLETDIHDDLDSVMRSFEQELSGGPAVGDPTLDSGDALPELGYLLEASDDELGLPSNTEAAKVTATCCPEGKEKEEDGTAKLVGDLSGLGEFWPFEEGMPSYDDSFGFGIGQQPDNDYVALDGIFDYSDVDFGPSDYAEIAWWPETLPAI